MGRSRMWILLLVAIGAALAVAMPRIMSDIRADREAVGVPTVVAQEQGSSIPIESSMPSSKTAPAPIPNATPDAIPVTTPEAGSPQRAAILGAIRTRLKSSARFKVDWLRTTSNWAFLRATEVVELDQGELQETDLTVFALLERPLGTSTGGWRIVDIWTLPTEEQHSLAEFTRRVRERQRAERLPNALIPDDL